jgi:NAD(P)H-dependent FMN reductase
LHRRLAAALVPIFAEHGVVAGLIDLADYPMPIYDGDFEQQQGSPESARRLTSRLTEFDGLVLVTPEYNGGPSALLKNTIDWVTRVDRWVFRPLLVGLAAGSPGSRGAVTGLGTVRRILEHMRLDVVEGHLSIPHAGEAFAADGVTLARTDDVAAAAAYVAAFAAELAHRSSPVVAS